MGEACNALQGWKVLEKYLHRKFQGFKLPGKISKLEDNITIYVRETCNGVNCIKRSQNTVQ